ncbi:MAG: hypothetical protein A3K19_33830 [Lentisphaerae bacterium RIFOXYB12_FULL_65_16]|nr:MAG: hypothetical protein A3K19_22275 [Lentisphaerae bacterium RIFOXYB12_FULL_65_16]OGV95247.1 MAG: hypothetical protein A3K19_33830 [Lentisphaerae bacterium RIFOXYB12_FULL_65_16]
MRLPGHDRLDVRFGHVQSGAECLDEQLLDKTDLSVWSIAREYGYTRQSYFTRRFRQVMGMTPRDYRARGSPSTAQMRINSSTT